MAKQTINIGTNQDDGTGDLLRVAFSKINENFTEVYTELGGSSLSSISLNSNVISTDVTNQDLVLSPSGSGELDISADTLIRGNLVVTGQSRSNTLQVDSNANIDGNLIVGGTTTFSALSIGAITGTSATFSSGVSVAGLLNATGSIDLGDSSADTITATARFDSSLVPSVTNTNDIGSGSLRWRDIYSRDIDARNGIFSGTMAITSNTTVGGNLDVTGNVTIGGNITIGDADTDSINVNAELANSLVPDADSTYNVGSDSKRYLNVFADIHKGLVGHFGNVEIANNKINTLTTNTDLTLATSGTGTINVSSVRITALADPTGAQDAATKTYVDTADALKLNLAGGTMGGAIAMGTNAITGMADPSGAQDAATKAYVDSQITGSTYSFNVADDSSTVATISSGEHLRIAGGTDLTSTLSSETITINNTSTLSTVTGRGATTTNAVSFNGGATVTTLNANTVESGSLKTTGLDLFQNNIFSRSTNEDIVLIPSGTGSVDVRSSKIINVTDPTNPQDAATKKYVDDNVGGGGDITAVVAGAGLTGGASSGSATLNVVGGTGIDANADDISIDSTVATLTGSQTLTNKTLTSPEIDTITTTGDLIINVSGSMILDADSGTVFVRDGAAGNYGQFIRNNANDLTIASGATQAVIFTGANAAFQGNITTTGTLNTHTIPGGTGTIALTSTVQGAIATAGNTGSGSIGVGDTLQALGTTNEINVDAAGSALSFSLADDITGIESISTQGLKIVDNNIQGIRSNDNIVLDPNGTGAVQVVGNLTVSGSISGTISGSVTGTVDADTATVSNLEVDNFKATAIVTESEGIGSNDNDTTLPTSAAVKDYVDNNVFDGAFASLSSKPTTLAGYGITDAANTSSETTFTADVKFDTGVEEKFHTVTGASGVTALDCNNGHVFYKTGCTGDITANFTNLGLTAEYATNLTVIINQGGTPYEVTAVQIGGAAQTLNWQGGTPPTGNANGIDAFSFTILNDGGSYVVLGQMVDFT